MSIEIKIYPSESLQSDEHLLFHACAYGSLSYDVFFDLAELYEYSFKTALDGTFASEYLSFSSSIPETIAYTINGADYVENIKKFCEYISEYEKAYSVIKENVQLNDIFGIKLVGAPYRADDNKPMVESYEYNVKRIMHHLKTNLFSITATNNVDDVYSLKKAGSLILTLSSSREYSDVVEFANNVYNDIQTKSIDINKFNDLSIKDKYINFIENLSELTRQRKLEKLFIIVDGVEKEITEKDYLKSSAALIYIGEVKVTGEFYGYKVGNNSFELMADKEKYYCHIVDNEHLKIVEKLSPFKKTKITVIGKKIKKKTMEVNKIIIELPKI